MSNKGSKNVSKSSHTHIQLHSAAGSEWEKVEKT
jgi:hypothetical protein